VLHGLKLKPSSQQNPVLCTEPPQIQALLNGEPIGQLSAGPLGSPVGGGGTLTGTSIQTPLEHISPLPQLPQLRLPAQPLLGWPHSWPKDWQVAGAHPPEVIHVGVESSSAAACEDHTAHVLS